MFTGIIQDVGRIVGRDERGGDVRLKIATQHLELQKLATGSSIAVNGVCLTALAIGTREFSADVSRETLQVTSLQTARVGTELNLECALRLTDGLDGHLVSGHVDATAAVCSLREDGRSWRCRIALPPSLRHFVAAKGSITVDGVSLTVNDVTATDFGINVIPHTFEKTIFKHYRNGTLVNLEVDLVARYTATLLAHGAG